MNTTHLALSHRNPSPSLELLAGWLRRAIQHPQASRLILRGSLLLQSWCANARAPQDVDYLLQGAFDPAEMERIALEITLLPDPSTQISTQITLERCEIIWAETPFPGLRAHLRGTWVQDHVQSQAQDKIQKFHVDFAFGDPMCQPPRAQEVVGVGSVLCAAPETLWAWKLHGLIEFGKGKWNAKTLFDLGLLGSSLALEPRILHTATLLAFSSRGAALNDLDDFRTRADWGLSASSQRKWRTFLKRNALDAVDLDFLELRERVKGMVEELHL